MSIRAMADIWESSPRKGSELLLLLAIADYSNDKNAAWPSIDSLATKTRMSRRNVQTLLVKLANDGDIRIEENAGPRGCNIYHLGGGVQTLHPCKPASPDCAGGGANQRRQIAPEPSGTTREPSGTESLTLLGEEIKNDIPEALDTDEFREAFKEFEEDRKVRKCPVTKAARAILLKKMEPWGSEKAVEALSISMEKCWRGVFEPKEQFQRNGNSSNGHHVDPPLVFTADLDAKKPKEKIIPCSPDKSSEIYRNWRISLGLSPENPLLKKSAEEKAAREARMARMRT